MSQQGRPAADAGISIGQVYLGKYRVDAILGHGGMGVVAKCTHLGLNDPVAMKMLRQDVLLDRDATERFMREAQAASKLRSEHVARVVDVGTFHDTGVPYMVMEFLDGHDLGELLDQRGSIPAPWASMLILQAAEALAEAHAIGIVHRDVKPSNLFVTWRPDGTAIIKVLDFGISKSPHGTDMKLTQTQSLLGTPAYMSPEQMRSARLVDARTDIWSLGIVFYELLEGHRPFEAESFSEMCVKVAVDAPSPMRNAPPPLQQVVLRCLAKSPEQRYSSMAELGRDLLPFVQEHAAGTLLVERMQRMAGRRSQFEIGAGTPPPWHPETPSPDGTPWHGADTGTRIPVRYQAPTSGPIAYADVAPSSTTIPDLPAIARAPSEVSRAPKRRRWIPVTLAGMVAGAGIGFGVYLGSDRDAPPPETDTTHVVAPPPTPPEPPKPDKAPEVKTDAVAKPETVAPPKADDPPKKDAGSATGEHATQTVVAQPPPKKLPQPPPKKWVPPKKDPNAGKEIKKDPKDVKEVKPPEKPRCPAVRQLPNGKCSDV